MEEQETLIHRGSQIEIPKDRLNMVYLIFYLLGLGSLLPWNFFITAKEYYQFKLRNTSYPEEEFRDPSIQTELQTVFEGTVAVASMVPNLMFNFITAALTKRMTIRMRMAMPIVIILLVFIGTVILTKVDTDEWQESFYILTIISVIVLNMSLSMFTASLFGLAGQSVQSWCISYISVSSSMFTASLFGLAGMFPTKYFQATMSGQAVGGIFAAVANILSLIGSNHILQSAFWFFMAASITCVVTLIGFLSLYYIKFSNYYLHTQFQVEILPDLSDEDTHVQAVLTSQPKYEVVYILKKIWCQGLSVGLVFFVTLCCFPAIASAIVSVSVHKDDWSKKYFSAVVCFLLFNVGDWAGRCLAGIFKFPRARQSTALLVSSCIRVVFIPLLILCHVVPRNNLPVVFDNDAWPVVFILLLGLTNGYLSTLCVMYGPKMVTAHQSEKAGAMMSVCLTVGLAMGSLTSLLLVKII